MKLVECIEGIPSSLSEAEASDSLDDPDELDDESLLSLDTVVTDLPPAFLPAALPPAGFLVFFFVLPVADH